MTLPAFPVKGLKGLAVKGVYYTRLSEAQSGLTVARNHGGGHFELRLTMRPYKREDLDEILAFLHARKGRYGLFTVTIPRYKDTKTGYTGIMLVNGANQQGGEILVDGMTPSTTCLKAGDVVSLNGHSKVYMVTEDLVSDGAGAGILKISPNLYASPPDNSAVIFNDVAFTVRSNNDEIEYSIDLSEYANFDLSFRETWENA